MFESVLKYVSHINTQYDSKINSFFLRRKFSKKYCHACVFKKYAENFAF